MFSLVAVSTLLLSTHYDSVEIPHLPKKTYLDMAFLTNSGMVGGSWYEYVAGQDRAICAAPFVWQKGELFSLPIGKYKYGHAYGGNDLTVVGNVQIDEKWFPTMWTPNKTTGWKGARMTLISTVPGADKVVAPDGTVWGEDANGIWSWRPGVMQSFVVGPCLLIGVDRAGTVYLNLSGGEPLSIGPEFRPHRYSKGKLEKLDIKGANYGFLDAVNINGVAVGGSSLGACRWVYGPMTALSTEYSRADAVNSLGDIVGHTRGERGDTLAALWKDGHEIDLSSAIRGVSLYGAGAINDKGQILAWSRTPGSQKLYLLSPKK